MVSQLLGYRCLLDMGWYATFGSYPSPDFQSRLHALEHDLWCTEKRIRFEGDFGARASKWHMYQLDFRWKRISGIMVRKRFLI